MPKDVYNNEGGKIDGDSLRNISVNLSALEKTSQLETIKEKREEYIDVIKAWDTGYPKR